MANVVIIGAGFAGHTAALYLGKHLGRKHKITVINKFAEFSYIPSWIWVGIGRMKPDRTQFRLAPIYSKMNVNFIQAAAKSIHPDDQFVRIAHQDGSSEDIPYDYLVVATGPALNFQGTPGLGPHDGFSYSVCTMDHAIQSRDAYLEQIAKMERGERVKMVIGTGHPGATCQGAAFEYIMNIHRDLERRNLRHKAELVWLSNERELGDFGVRGLEGIFNGEKITSADFMEAVFDDAQIEYEIQKGVTCVEEGRIFWEDFEGNEGSTTFDFAMLIPQFVGPKLDYIGRDGEDISEKLVNKAGFILVDAMYGLSHDQLAQTPEAWPSTYQNPSYPNIFAAGIAFAPPGTISVPHVNPNGLSISAAPPRTGMVSAIIGRIVALNIVDLVNGEPMSHTERMTEMAAACIASMGDSLWDGSAAVMVIHPVVPDFKQYPETGRDQFVTHMEMGLSGAWMKRLIHSTMMYKMHGYPGWELIPE